MRLLLLTLACLAGSLAYGQHDHGPVDEMGYHRTEAGTRYRMLTESDANPPAAGQYLYFHAKLLTERDSVIFDSRTLSEDNFPVIEVPAPDVTNLGPVEDVLRYLGDQESVLIRIDISEESIGGKPPGMEKDTVILYQINVVEVISPEQYGERLAAQNAAQEKDRALARAREEEVLTLTDSLRQRYVDGTLSGLTTTESGLRYIILKKTDAPRAEDGRAVTVHYVGSLPAPESVFDQSFARGEPISFMLGAGRVIPGWDEGISLLGPGERALLVIPPDLGYGAAGTPGVGGESGIPPNATLLFYVELVDVK